MLTISKAHRVYKMSPDNPAAATANSGDTVRFETLDCFGDQITSEDQLCGGLDWSNINPATGPLFINGAEVGDVLKVEILDIELNDHGTMVDAPGEGITGSILTDERTKILPVKDGIVTFNDKLTFPINPMIGVIGTTPAAGGIETGTPDFHGGNMDCKKIGIGTTLYLPVNAPGALLAMGDMHAVMGDGEVEVCGVEIGGVITVKVTVLKDCKLPTPFLTRDSIAAAVYSAPTLDDAAIGATMAMHRFLTDELKLDQHEAGMLLSVAGDLCICQAVDPQKTCRMELPLDIMAKYGYRFA